jgi:hypothetical protein
MKWIKLYTEILMDPKMGRLTDRQHRTCINLFLLAGQQERDGLIGPLPDIAWQLHLSEQDLAADMEALAGVGIVQEQDGEWYVRQFTQRQERPPSDSPDAVTDRVQRFRGRQRNGDVTPVKRECNEDVTPPCNAEQTREEQTRIEENRQEPDWPPATLPIGEQQKLTLMDGAGIAQPMALQFAEKCTLKRVQDVIGYARSSPGLQNPTAYVVSMLRSGQTLPKAPMPRAKSPPKRLPGEPCYDEAELARLRAMESTTPWERPTDLL